MAARRTVYLPYRFRTSFDWRPQKKIPSTPGAFDVGLGVVKRIANPYHMFEDELLWSAASPVEQHLSTVVPVAAILLAPTIVRHITAVTPAILSTSLFEGTPFRVRPKVGQEPLHSLV